MDERENVYFFDTQNLTETAGVKDRCNNEYLQRKLNEKFPQEKLEVDAVKIISGKYVNKSDGFIMSLTSSYRIKNLPPFCEVRISHATGSHTEKIIVWSPLAWNDRFMGTGGGGTGTGGDNYIRRPNNLSRAQNLAFAVMNGFSAATTNGAGNKNNWAIDPKTNKLHLDLIENWHGTSTHFMTVIGKAVAEILHERKVAYSYFHGGSGGGRQSMVEAQEYPTDYDGIWASCPAMNWTKFLIAGFYPIAVMNSLKHVISADVLEFFKRKAQEKVGGEQKYYEYSERVEFDPCEYIGQKYKGNKKITECDALVMKKIFDGPRDENGNELCKFFRPGCVFWIKVLPLAAIYYPLLSKKPKPFFLCNHYASWVTEQAKVKLDDITIEEFNDLLKKSLTKFPTLGADNPDLKEFYNAGGKLIIDHGTDDPLIPVDGSIDYYDKVLNVFDGNKQKVDEFFKLYVTPGDGHGSCVYHAPGITEKDGMTKLIAWVENDDAPNEIRTIKGDKKGNVVKESSVKPY